jgi:uroporphyrinogen III methyltransferase / synthase
MASRPPGAAGVVHLVGAGPGDPTLMTARALELIAAADVILHDRLVPAGALAGARPDAELVYVGKEPGGKSSSQEEINAQLVDLARAGKTVVRLKGGDPFVFGRGGEEAQALAAAGVRFEVVPGITAGLAAPALAGIPVTHRQTASAVALVTAHEDPTKQDSALDWAALARFPGTLVLYMGVARLGEAARRLVAEGRPAGEPAAVIERGALPGQRTVTGTLADIADRAAEAGVRPPAVALVGEVASLRDQLAWLELRPLHGTRVVVTRARAQASALAARLAALGADVVETPVIRIVPRPIEGEVADAADAIDSYALVCLTSSNGADLLMDALVARGRDARALAGTTVAAIGPGTAAALAARGVLADVVPERSVAEGLVEALEAVEVGGRRVLVARAADARELLPEALRARGADVDVVALYDTAAEPLDPEAPAAIAAADFVTFTSSSTVRFFMDALEEAGGALNPNARIVSIGPITSAAIRERGMEVHREADSHDIDGLVDALLADAAEVGGR